MRPAQLVILLSISLGCWLQGQTPSPVAPAVYSEPAATADPLLRILVSKGLVTAQELREMAASDPGDQRARLARLLHHKGLLTDSELEEVVNPGASKRFPPTASLRSIVPQPVAAAAYTPAAVVAHGAPSSSVASAAMARPAVVIPAVAPLRVLQFDPVKRDGMIPDLKLGSGAKLKLYGMVKASAIYDTSAPSGTDMPLPYLGGDTGPTVDPEFHVRARNMRLGSQFEWLDLSPKTAVTGRFETDFEGSFTRAMNRNISSVPFQPNVPPGGMGARRSQFQR